MKDTYKSFIVPAGKYWLDDPSFVVQASDDWSAYCTACDHEDMSTEEYKELFKTSPYEALSYQLNGHYVQLPDGTKVLSFSTAGERNGWYDDHASPSKPTATLRNLYSNNRPWYYSTRSV